MAGSRHLMGWRSIRPLSSLCLAALSLGAGAVATAAAPVDVILVVDTEPGAEQGVVREYGLDTFVYGAGSAERLANLQQALGAEEVVIPLVMRLACPAGTRREECYNFQATLDVDFGDALANVTAPTLIVVRPEVGYWSKERAYYARYWVDLFHDQPLTRVRSFRVGYFDWNCDVDCLRAAQEAAARELADMVSYMRGLEFDDWGLPPSWEKLPKVRDFDQWSNDCPYGPAGARVVREGARRFWLGRKQGRYEASLDSLAWTGCNSYVPQHE